MGTPEFAIESLGKILTSSHQLEAVVTAPDRPAGRGKKLKSSAVKEFALSNNIKVLQPPNLKDSIFINELKTIDADLFVVVAFRMLPEIVWSMPKLGTINLHASLLPNYRGAAPINWAIINGEKITGVSTFFIEKEIDTGKIIQNKTVQIDELDNVGTLHNKLMHQGASLLLNTINDIENNNIQAYKQEDNKLLKSAPKINKLTGKIDWSKTNTEINNLIRGLSPYPGAWTHVMIDEKKLILKIFSAIPLNSKLNTGEIKIINNELHIGCSFGSLKLAEIQLEGKKRMPAKEFIKGARITNSKCL
jgi:methionyl-tRNA formyltransferase